MSFSHDRRGQSVVVGTVILFGFLILALSIYQVQFVPAENSEIEFEHSQQVEGDFLDLRNALLTAGRTGEARSTSIRLGTRYPQRTFFLNPPPASGKLSTTGQNTIVIQNASVAGSNNTKKYWEKNRADEDGNIPFDTRSVRYSPNYNELQNGPDLIYEHSLVAAEFENTVLSRTGQTVVRGDRNRISLTMIDGDLSISATERQSLDPETLSQQRRTVTLQPDDGTVTLVLPTAVESETKRDDLAEEWEEAIEAEVTTSVEGEAIRIEVETEGSIQLALSQVGLGSGISKTDESDGYITKISDRDGVAVAEVRDRFNNPVEDAEVTITVDGTDSTETTDEDGRLEYEVEAPPEDVRMSINDDIEMWEFVEFLNVGAGSDGGGDGGSDQSGVGQGGDSTWSEDDTTETISTQGGLWTDLGNINSIVLSNLRLSPVARDGSKAAEERYFRLAFTIGDNFDAGDGTRYVFVLDEEDAYELDDLADAEQTVTVYEETKQSGTISATALDELDEAELDSPTLQALIEDGAELDLLDSNNWAEPTDVEGDLETIRNYLNSNDGQEAFITDINGRVDLTLEQRDDGGSGDNGDEPPMVQSELQYEGGLTTTTSGSATQFNVGNVGDNFARINAVRIDSEISAAPKIYNGDGGRVVEITGGNPDGFLQTSGPNVPSNAIDADGSSQTLDQTAVLEDGDEGTVFVGQFGEAQGGPDGGSFDEYDFGSLTRVSGEEDWDIEIALEFQDRPNAIFYFSEE